MGRARKGFYFTTSEDASKPSRFIYEACGVMPPSSPLYTLSTRKKVEEAEESEEEEPPSAKDLLMSQHPLKLMIRKELDHISYQELDSYFTCELQYCYENRLNIPVQHTNARGKALFASIQDYLTRKRDNQAIDTEYISKIWKEVDPEGQDEEGKASATASLSAFEAKTKSEMVPKSTKFDESFNFIFDGVAIKGAWDRIDQSESGTILRQLRTSVEKGRKIPKVQHRYLLEILS
jgi:hypothetical protein